MMEIINQVTSLGGNPLLMLHKLADVGGLEILDADTHMKGSVPFHYRVIAKVSNNLYIEAYDPLNEFVGAENDRRFQLRRYTTASGGPGTLNTTVDLPSAQTQEFPVSPHVSLPVGDAQRVYMAGILVPDQPDMTTLPLECALSMQMAARSSRHYSSTVRAGAIGLAFAPSTSFNLVKSGGRWFFPGSVPFTVVTPVYSHESSYGGMRLWPNPLISDPAWTFNVLYASEPLPLTLARGYGKKADGPNDPAYAVATDSFMGLWGYSGYGNYSNSVTEGYSFPQTFSGGMIRVSSGISGEGALVSPSEWCEIPIATSLFRCGDDGLVFRVGSVPNNHLGAGTWFVGMVNTSKGNGFGGGKCPVVLRFHGASNGTSASWNQVKASVHGDMVPLSGTKIMGTYSSPPPIANDVYAGGPVVSDLFIVGDNEIRGVATAFLSCSDSLPIGSSGWLDGKRYAVVAPGRMQRVG